MASASEAIGEGGGGELVQVVLKPLLGGGGGSVEASGGRRHRQALEFEAVADSWIATVSWSHT